MTVTRQDTCSGIILEKVYLKATRVGVISLQEVPHVLFVGIHCHLTTEPPPDFRGISAEVDSVVL